MATATFHFPRGFRWGTATAAHQVEGGNINNQWHVWEQTPGRIHNNEVSGQACDWWNNFEEDFDRMAAMGLNAHRLSVEWSRVEPRPGVYDDAAIDRYRAMLRALRKRGIEPMVTLHHFTNPIWLDEQGGMLNPRVTVPAFERFVEHLVTRLDDVCDLWCTVNEPNVFAVMGYMGGRMPPGLLNSYDKTLQVACAMLAMHSAAAQAIRRAQGRAQIGLAHHMRVFEALRKNNPLDALAARVQDAIFNDALLSTLLTGRWHWALRRYAPAGFKLARNTLDWVGLNYYTRQATRFNGLGDTGYGSIENFPGAVMSDHEYGELYPAGLLKMLRRLHKTKLPIYITENGIPDHDDDQRPGFLVTHLREVWKAIQFCFDVRGYYHWSFVDNFEWSEGWRMRFGLYAMDEKTGARTLRPSGALYGEIARANALTVDMAARYAPDAARALFP